MKEVKGQFLEVKVHKGATSSSDKKVIQNNSI